MRNSEWREFDFTPSTFKLQRPGNDGSTWEITRLPHSGTFMLRHWVPAKDYVKIYTTYHMTLLDAKRAAK